MKDLCPGCACWVEDGWSYCMQCGTARVPPRRRSLTPSRASSDDVYGRKNSVMRRLKQVPTPPKERGKGKLLRKRQSSHEVRHQLQQVRTEYPSTMSFVCSVGSCDSASIPLAARAIILYLVYVQVIRRYIIVGIVIGY